MKTEKILITCSLKNIANGILLRGIIQSVFLIITLYTGWSFHRYTEALRSGNFDAVKPGGVEAFLPISALMALKRFVLTGAYDYVHPAGLTLLMMFLFISAVIKRSFCGYVCPVGFISEIIGKAGKGFKIHKFAVYPLLTVKYLLLGFFLYIIVFSMPVEAIDNFLSAPYNTVADAKMLAFFADPSKTTLIFLAVLLILGLLFRNFWCRFLCPYGALMGIASVISPFKIKRDASACTDCLKCTDACPSGIEVHKKNTVRSIECVGCHDCVRVRSNENCLKSNIANPKAAAFMIVIIATIAMIAAKLCGYWYSDVSGETYAYWLERLGQLTH